MMSKERASAYYDLSVMLEAGLPIVRSLKTVSTGAHNRIRRAFSAITESVARGDSVSKAMADNPRNFKRIDNMIVAASEESGNLAEAFGMLSKWYEFTSRLRSRMLSGLLYPLFIIHFAALALPIPGLVLGHSGISGYVRAVLTILAIPYIPTLAIIAVIKFTPETGPARYMVDAMALRVPLLGRALRDLAISRYCLCFNMMYKAGVRIDHCAEKSATIAGNAVVARMLAPGTEAVKQGKPPSTGFSAGLPAEFRDLWLIGEESGELEKVTHKLGDLFADTGQRRLAEFTQWMPRLLYFAVLIISAVMIIRAYMMIMSARGF